MQHSAAVRQAAHSVVRGTKRNNRLTLQTRPATLRPCRYKPSLCWELELHLQSRWLALPQAQQPGSWRLARLDDLQDLWMCQPAAPAHSTGSDVRPRVSRGQQHGMKHGFGFPSSAQAHPADTGQLEAWLGRTLTTSGR